MLCLHVRQGMHMSSTFIMCTLCGKTTVIDAQVSLKCSTHRGELYVYGPNQRSSSGHASKQHKIPMPQQLLKLVPRLPSL